MCGFALLNRPGKQDLVPVTEMLQQIARRGPDAQGSHSALHVSMSHARLSIVGGEHGRQPMPTKDGLFWIVFNGEIYNYTELRSMLVAENVVFGSDSDTEVLLQGYIHWGRDVFRKIDGMFSVAIWDVAAQQIICARDRFGIKPLFLAKTAQGGVAIASDVSAFRPLRNTGVLSSKLHPDALREYLSMGYVLEPTTWYQDTVAVTPGTCVRWSSDTTHAPILTDVFWDLETQMMRPAASLSAMDGRDLLMQSMHSHLPRDPNDPFSIFLSGGVDSSLIAEMSRRQRPDTRIFAATAFFDSSTNNESTQAYQTAQRLNLSFLPLGLKDQDCLAPQLLLDIFREPFADNASLPTHALAKQAVRHSKIVFSGDGADEIFFGYRNHWLLHLESVLKPSGAGSSLYKSILQTLCDISPQSGRLPRVLRWKSTLQSLLTPMTESYIQAFSQASVSDVNALLGGFADSCSIQAKLAAPDSLSELEDPMKVVQWMDLKGYLPSCILKKTDRATMALGLEARVPFLSHELTTAMLSQPSRGQVGFRSGKHTLRHWARPMLGAQVAQAKKTSFTSPLDQWFYQKTPQELRTMILEPLRRSVWSDRIDLIALERIISEHQCKFRHHGPLLWSLMLLSKFEP